MKKLLFGMMMFCSGSLSVAMLLAGSMANDWTLNSQSSALWISPGTASCLPCTSFSDWPF